MIQGLGLNLDSIGMRLVSARCLIPTITLSCVY